MATENTARLAVLIDADNAQPSITEGLLAEVAKYGTAHVKRAYGDWTAPNLRGWKDQLLAQSIQPIQQFAYTTGKNATDAAMVIDAMDLLYSGRFDGFCIVSSDSDFTRLAARLRESGMTVYGFGERKTPKPFVAACDKFIYVENLRFTDEVQDAGGDDAGRQAGAAQAGHGGAAQERRRPGEPAPQRGRGGVRRRRLGAALRGRQHHHQPAPRLRLAQLRLRQAERPDQGDHAVRDRAAQPRRRQAGAHVRPREAPRPRQQEGRGTRAAGTGTAKAEAR